uniref:Uncharacterized protein n=1 Tax=Caenorhabditis japonica TaxID=281687 RepID=A0A8R1EJY7_CAEJA
MANGEVEFGTRTTTSFPRSTIIKQDKRNIGASFAMMMMKNLSTSCVYPFTFLPSATISVSLSKNGMATRRLSAF